MYSRIRRRLPSWAMVALVVVLLIGMPLLIPVAVVSQAIYKFRMRQAAKSFACMNCNTILGLGALTLADQVWGEHIREVHRNPGLRYRIVRTLHAICLNCGTR